MNRITRALFALALVCVPAIAWAQSQFPPPSTPVTVCFTQPQPTADSYLVVFDGGTPEAVTAGAPGASCPGATHSFQLPAARFTVGTHTIVLRAVNTFGSADSAPYSVVVGIKPGQPVVSGVVVGG